MRKTVLSLIIILLGNLLFAAKSNFVISSFYILGRGGGGGNSSAREREWRLLACLSRARIPSYLSLLITQAIFIASLCNCSRSRKTRRAQWAHLTFGEQSHRRSLFSTSL